MQSHRPASSRRASTGQRLGEARDRHAVRRRAAAEFDAVCDAADALRASVSGDTVRYVVNRNINYTNSAPIALPLLRLLQGQARRHSARAGLRSRPRGDRPARARSLGARRDRSLHAGRHPSALHRRDLSWHPRRREARRAATSTCTPSRRSKCSTARPASGLTSAISSTGCATRASAACPAPRRRSSTTRSARCSARTSSRRSEWLADRRDRARRRLAHHRDHHVRPCRASRVHWARHLLHIRDLQERTGGFTEFVPLPFVHMEAPIYLKGRARKGPTLARSGADARGRAARAASAHPQHPGVVGEARAATARAPASTPAPTISAAR